MARGIAVLCTFEHVDRFPQGLRHILSQCCHVAVATRSSVIEEDGLYDVSIGTDALTNRHAYFLILHAKEPAESAPESDTQRQRRCCLRRVGRPATRRHRSSGFHLAKAPVEWRILLHHIRSTRPSFCRRVGGHGLVRPPSGLPLSRLARLRTRHARNASRSHTRSRGPRGYRETGGRRPSSGSGRGTGLSTETSLASDN